MSTKKGKSGRTRKPPIKVTTRGDIASADIKKLASCLLNIHRRESESAIIRSAVFEAVQTNIAGSLPPMEPDPRRGITHNLWIPVEQKLPDHDRMVEVWNTGVDQIEEAFFDTEATRWVPANPLTTYMFGEITHWREKLQQNRQGVPAASHTEG